ncbi:hypothetical protein ACJX0J_011752, partial [Zea mays]
AYMFTNVSHRLSLDTLTTSISFDLPVSRNMKGLFITCWLKLVIELNCDLNQIFTIYVPPTCYHHASLKHVCDVFEVMTKLVFIQMTSYMTDGVTIVYKIGVLTSLAVFPKNMLGIILFLLKENFGDVNGLLIKAYFTLLMEPFNLHAALCFAPLLHTCNFDTLGLPVASNHISAVLCFKKKKTTSTGMQQHSQHLGLACKERLMAKMLPTYKDTKTYSFTSKVEITSNWQYEY